MPTPRRNRAMPKEINGAVSSSPKTVENTSKASTSEPSSHQTHGGYTPVSGPILSAQQLLRGKNVGRGAVGSFESLGAYTRYLKTLSNADLHRHAVDEAHIVAIDDRERLIKRLEAEWTGITAREASSSAIKVPSKRVPFSPEQVAAQNEIREKLLKK